MNNNEDQFATIAGNTQRFPTHSNEPYLVVLYPENMRGSYQLSQIKPLIIGRSKDCDIYLNDSWISRKHCQVSLSGKNIKVTDLGSTNGTFVDSQQIEEATMTIQNRLHLGQIIIKFEYKASDEVEYDQKLFHAATMDALTQIHNRHWFMEHAETEISSFKRTDDILNLMMLDIDFFKKVNDTYGHQAGDFILKEVAYLLNLEKRDEDYMGRYGGEEFIFLFRRISLAEAENVCQRMRKRIESANLIFEGTKISVTISLGLVSRIGNQITSLGDMIKDADDALYQAKEHGRNQLIVSK